MHLLKEGQGNAHDEMRAQVFPDDTPKLILAFSLLPALRIDYGAVLIIHICSAPNCLEDSPTLQCTILLTYSG